MTRKKSYKKKNIFWEILTISLKWLILTVGLDGKDTGWYPKARVEKIPRR